MLQHELEHIKDSESINFIKTLLMYNSLVTDDLETGD